MGSYMSLCFENHQLKTSLDSLVALMVKKSACNIGDLGSIPDSGRSPKEVKGYPLKYSCLENSLDRGTWQDTVHEISELDTTD